MFEKFNLVCYNMLNATAVGIKYLKYITNFVLLLVLRKTKINGIKEAQLAHKSLSKAKMFAHCTTKFPSDIEYASFMYKTVQDCFGEGLKYPIRDQNIT